MKTRVCLKYFVNDCRLWQNDSFKRLKLSHRKTKRSKQMEALNVIIKRKKTYERCEIESFNDRFAQCKIQKLTGL